MLTEDGWLRFSVVRGSGPRLWSAWQSKLLLREPRFLSTTERAVVPIPHHPMDPVEDFRRFVLAVAAGEAVDVHWCVQHDLVDRLALDHVGRLESLDDTLALLRAHVPDELWPEETSTRTGRRSPCRRAFDEAAAGALNRHYAADFEAYGYDRAEPADDEALAEWRERAAPLLPLVQETIDRHIRIGQLHRMARRVHTVELAGDGRRPAQRLALPGADEPRGSGRLQRSLGLGRADSRARLRRSSGRRTRSARSRGCCLRFSGPPSASC